MWFMEEPSQYSVGQTARSLTNLVHHGETTYRPRGKFVDHAPYCMNNAAAWRGGGNLSKNGPRSFLDICTWLDDCLRMLQACFRKRMSDLFPDPLRFSFCYSIGYLSDRNLNSFACDLAYYRVQQVSVKMTCATTA